MLQAFQGCRQCLKREVGRSYGVLKRYATLAKLPPKGNPMLAQALDQLDKWDTERIRNLCIIAHVDHGKSTLADRLLELTGTVPQSSNNKQILDRLVVERQRGITVKAQSVTMFYGPDDHGMFMINLIDTPGHADFAYEVSRSMAACDGAILLVDANQGVQAQTVANFWKAFEADLTILPVLNKVDLDRAQPERAAAQLRKLFDIEPDQIIRVSAKTGLNIAEQLLPAIIDRLPPPKKSSADGDALDAFIFDSWFEQHHGSLASVLVKKGTLRVGQNVMAVSSGKSYEVKELGIMSPDRVPVDSLVTGQVGYVKCGMKTVGEARVGDVLCEPNDQGSSVLAAGFRVPKPVVFACMYPIEQTEIQTVQNALERLTLNDPAVTVELTNSPALGQGWRLGFLGLLHLEVFSQRLDDEYDAPAMLTAPSLTFRAKIKDSSNLLRKYSVHPTDSRVIDLVHPSEFPPPSDVEEYLEPVVLATIVVPMQSFNDVTKMCLACRGTERSTEIIDDDRVCLKYTLPLSEVVVDFYENLKQITSGYGSFDYEDSGYVPASLAKLTVHLNKKLVEEFSQIVPTPSARERAKSIGRRLRQEIPAQIMDIDIDVKVNGRAASHHRIIANKKDVTAKLYGGDITRRKKVLARQAEGKERLKLVHSVNIPKSVFINVFKR